MLTDLPPFHSAFITQRSRVHPVEASKRRRRSRPRFPLQGSLTDHLSGLYGTGPARGRAAVPGSDRAREKEQHGYSFQRKLQRAGPRPSPTPGSARPSSTASPSAATSSRPAPTPTASCEPAPEPGTRPPDIRIRCPLPPGGSAGGFPAPPRCRPCLPRWPAVRSSRPAAPWPRGGPAAVLPRQSQRAGTGSAERLAQNPRTTLAHPPAGRLPAGPGGTWNG